MFQRNPVKTEEGIFRRDIAGNWWELHVKPLPKQNLPNAEVQPHKLSEAVKNLEGAVVFHDGDENTLIVKGWKKVSASHRVVEIEKSVNSGRIVLEIDFI